MHYVGRVDWAFSATPGPQTADIVRPCPPRPRRARAGSRPTPSWRSGPWRRVAGSPGTCTRSRRPSTSSRASVLLEIDRHVHRLVAGDFGFIPIGMPHTLAAPRPTPACAGWASTRRRGGRPTRPCADTVFATRAPDVDALCRGGPPARGGRSAAPLRRPLRGHAAAGRRHCAITEPARGRRPAGMDTALLAYNGISVKMLVDRTLGADHLTMFTVDYELGARRPGARPSVRGGLLLPGRRGRGRARRPALSPQRRGCRLRRRRRATHGFWNEGTERVRWIETQAPQPPARHSYRWQPTLGAVAARGGRAADRRSPERGRPIVPRPRPWRDGRAAGASGLVTGDRRSTWERAQVTGMRRPRVAVAAARRAAAARGQRAPACSRRTSR